MGQTYKIGTRTSPLALRQVEEVLNALEKFYPAINPVRNLVLPGSKYSISNGVNVEIVGMETYGDRNKTIPISQIEGSDFFTKEIDDALLNDKIDFAVHSAKDLPDNLKEGLVVAAITKSIDPYDVLVSKSGLKLNELEPGARIGTSSLRRKKQLKEFREDFRIVDIRGNIGERLKLLDDNEPPVTNRKPLCLDGIIIAAAGLLRLGLEHRITQRIPFNILRPHPLQGSLAITTRAERSNLISLISLLDSRRAISE